MGSARVSRVGLGVAPKQSFLDFATFQGCHTQRKAGHHEDALTNTRDACATRSEDRLRASPELFLSVPEHFAPQCAAIDAGEVFFHRRCQQ